MAEFRALNASFPGKAPPLPIEKEAGSAQDPVWTL
jgi:hypothetical protein